jgi:hypothetical protein
MIVLAIVCVPAAVAFASAPGDAEQTTPPAATIEPTTTDEAATEPEDVPEPPAPAALTPEGNLTLVDDIEGEQASDKQFFTVITKSGNYFYLVIDRAGDTENVHFLNLVDEADLLALIEDTQPAPATTAPAVTEPAPTEATEPEPVPKPEESSLNIGAILAAIVVLALVGGGALFYVKVLKPKRGAKATGNLDLDGFDFGDEDEDMPYGTPDRDYTEPDIDIEDISEPGDDMGRYGALDKEFGTGVEPETEETK